MRALLPSGLRLLILSLTRMLQSTPFFLLSSSSSFSCFPSHAMRMVSPKLSPGGLTCAASEKPTDSQKCFCCIVAHTTSFVCRREDR